VFRAPIERTGELVSDNDGGLHVRFEQLRSCESCGNHSVCGMRLLGGSPDILLKLPASDSLDCLQETRVTVELPLGGFGHLLALCYLMQPVCMLLGAWLMGSVVWDSDLAAAGGALGGLAVGCFLLWLYDALGGGQDWLRKLIIRPSVNTQQGRA
jgi:positive regulator of sigma E activity